MRLKVYKNLQSLVFPEWRDLPIEHGYTTRLGGQCHDPDFGSFNLSRKGIDDEELLAQVQANRRQFSDELGIPLSDMVTGKQVHSDHITIIDDSFTGFDRGVDERLMENDALITAGERMLLTWHADCVPIYYFDPENRVIALAHAGWRGTFARLAGKVVAELTNSFNTNPAKLAVGIGPCALASSYEVGEELLTELEDIIGQAAKQYFTPINGAEKYYLDLVALNTLFLQDQGVPLHNIVGGDCDTVTDERLFSHRRQGDRRGTNAAYIQLKNI